MWRIGRAPNNASKWQMGFHLAFNGLKKFYVGSGVNLRVSDFLPGWRSYAHNEELAGCIKCGEFVFQ